MPAVVGDRHVIGAFLIGFATQIVAELYQIATVRGVVANGAALYYLSIAVTVVGFYFFWRAFHEWNQLHPRARAARTLKIPWTLLGYFAAGVLAVALTDLLLGTYGTSDVPAPVVWIVGSIFLLALGSFFFRLRALVRRYQTFWGLVCGWAAFLWSLGISAIAGVALGLRIEDLFIDFFSNWSKLFADLAPFIYALAPLIVTWSLLTIAYAQAHRRVPPSLASPRSAVPAAQ